MATVRASLSHEERTAQEPRESVVEPVVLSQIESVNKTIRLLRLSSVDPKHELRVIVNPPSCQQQTTDHWPTQ